MLTGGCYGQPMPFILPSCCKILAPAADSIVLQSISFWPQLHVLYCTVLQHNGLNVVFPAYYKTLDGVVQLVIQNFDKV